jgi:hypothetical protein
LRAPTASQVVLVRWHHVHRRQRAHGAAVAARRARAGEPVFALVPTESVIKEHQKDHHAALARSDRAGDSTAFVEFALGALKAGLEGLLATMRPRPLDSAQRLTSAYDHFGRRFFSRRDYLALLRGIQTATASRSPRRDRRRRPRQGRGQGDRPLSLRQAPARRILNRHCSLLPLPFRPWRPGVMAFPPRTAARCPSSPPRPRGT